MQFKRIHYLFAGLSFGVALFTYVYTMQPSIPFWDCGEFAAAAVALQVPHPPGSPLWTIVGRIAMLLPTFTDLVARYNFFSALSSALSILLLYLTTARLIKIWRGSANTMADALTTYGGALIAALTYTFTDSFWFNALECEVYAFGSLFIALVPYIMVLWLDHADEPHNEKYLLLAAYTMGLSLGVHQLALLTIFPSFMLIYYKRRNDKVTVASWLGMVLASSIAFGIAFWIVLSKIVEWLGNPGFSRIFVILLFIGTIYGIWWSQKNRKPTLNLSLWAAALLFLGYSTYYMIIVRAGQEPPMNQHHADTFKVITEFINRDQYGYRPPLPRQAHDPERADDKNPTFTNYSGGWDFFWRYQTDHMFNRYFGWNFIGRPSQKQDAGVDWSKTWGLAFLLGLFGLYWHFKRDPNRALTILGAFILFGWMTAWYQNQQDPQPRERDYFYVGAFYLFAIWVGIGATGVMEFLRARKDRPKADEGEKRAPLPIPTGEGNLALIGGVLAALVVLVPLNQCCGIAGMITGKSFAETSKWHEYSRRHCDIPLEFAYNTLQSCDKDAILFTAGDNDTFPLWCAQDVYGIRRDVRIVNLSLANMSWYIKQIKKDVWHGEGKGVNLPGFPDEMLAQPDNTPGGVNLDHGQPKMVSVPVTADAMKKFSGDPNATASTMTWKYKGQFSQENESIWTIADQVIRSVVEGNISSRPIYFAAEVGGEYLAGLDQNLMWEGLSQRVSPTAPSLPLSMRVYEKQHAGACFDIVKTPHKEPYRGFMINTFRDPAARWSNDDRTNDAPFFSIERTYEMLAEYYLSKNQPQDAKRALDTLDYYVPPERVTYSVGNLSGRISQIYAAVGDKKMATKYGTFALKGWEDEYNETLTEKTLDERGLYAQTQYADALIGAGQYDKAFSIYNNLRQTNTDKQFAGPIELRWMQLSAMNAERKGDKRTAVSLYDKLFATFGSELPKTQYAQEFALVQMHLDSLHRQLGDSAAHAPPAGALPPANDTAGN
ncbi:MAG TPA: DUF2723 domain-containing protein [Candidatus Kapabacteria bacterium]|nr:DUF2723 domain-containing protein [Candidatus Kapabacteria bacterium]